MAEQAAVNATSQNTLLTDFSKSARLLAQWLEEGPKLGTIEQIALENHIHVIHFSYGAWKRQRLMTETVRVLQERDPKSEGRDQRHEALGRSPAQGAPI